MNILQSLKYNYKNGGIVIKLIYINVVVFVLVSIVSVFLKLFELPNVLLSTWFSVPSNPNELIRHFWTPLTYMFYHEKFFHIFFNMLVLYWFGKIFLMYFSEKKLVSLYIFGGLFGALMYVLAYNFFPFFKNDMPISILMGASGSIMAILVASAARAPNMEMGLLLIGRIKLMWIAIITILISFFGITSGNGGGEMAHLGGALAGYLFVVFDRKGKDITSFVNVIINFFVNLFRPKPTVKKKTQYHAQRMSPEEYNQKKASDEIEINRILDKIKTSGYESLTTEEKKKLFEQKR